MRLRTVLATLFVGSTLAAAQPGGPADPPVPDAPPPEEQKPPPPPAEAPTPTEPSPVEPAPAPPPPPAPGPVVTGPPGALPPITITITNNNTGNNSNTNTQTNDQKNENHQTNDQKNDQKNDQQNTQTNDQKNTQTNDQKNEVTVTAPITVAPPLAPPGRVERGRHPTIERIAIISPKPERTKWLAVGLTLGDRGPGVRASLDLFGRGHITLGLAASASAPGGHGGDRHGGMHGGGDASAIAYVAYTRRLGPLDVGAQVGLGVGLGDQRGAGDAAAPDATNVARTVGGTDTTSTDTGRPRLAPRAEAALLVGLPLTERLGIVAGPVLSTTADDTAGGMRDLGGRGDHGHPEVDARVMAGLRFGF